MYVNAAMYLEVFQTSFIFHGISRSALDDLSSGNSFAYDYSTYGQRLQRPHLTSSSSLNRVGAYALGRHLVRPCGASYHDRGRALPNDHDGDDLDRDHGLDLCPCRDHARDLVPSAAAAAAAAIAVATISIVAPAVSIAAAVSSSFVLRRLAPGKALIDLFTTLSGATKSTSQATRLPVSNSSSSFNVDENTSFIDLASVSIFVGFLEVPRRFEFNKAVPT
eukprot:CAMPEP_0167804228 /NCGR_PEP_ID=MMETSP0111_2-20121227/20348_1 /TAXON_ID=91324 /ORGANISM="Lotharella globosa, Strain CCCM811" /LENGTH=220 /DNA_ID=CAMNT_0007700931 /DNA_START=6 /DNA_END=669 /DNA_ORIENTATION=-